MSSAHRSTPLDSRFDEFVTRHRPGVLRVIGARVGGSAPAEIPDVCAEVFLVAFRRFDLVGAMDECAARRWLAQVARFKTAHHHRSRARLAAAYARAVGAGEVQVVYLVQVDDGLGHVDDDAEAVAVRRQVEAVMQSIDPSHRVTLDAVSRWDGTLAGLAAHLGVSQGALRLRWMRARRAFRDEYVRRFPNDEPCGSTATRSCGSR